MGKFVSSRDREESLKEKRAPAEAAWRAIGVALFFIVPIMSWAAATVTLDEGVKRGWLIPADMVGFVRFPPEAYTTPGISPIALWLSSIENLVGIVVLTIVYLFFLGGLISFIYSVLYRMNVPRYGKFDAPPPKRRPKPYKR